MRSNTNNSPETTQNMAIQEREKERQSIYSPLSTNNHSKHYYAGYFFGFLTLRRGLLAASPGGEGAGAAAVASVASVA